MADEVERHAQDTGEDRGALIPEFEAGKNDDERHQRRGKADGLQERKHLRQDHLRQQGDYPDGEEIEDDEYGHGDKEIALIYRDITVLSTDFRGRIASLDDVAAMLLIIR